MDLSQALKRANQLQTDLRHPDYKNGQYVGFRALPHEAIPVFLAISCGWECKPREKKVCEDLVRKAIFAVLKKYIASSKQQEAAEDLLEEIFDPTNGSRANN